MAIWLLFCAGAGLVLALVIDQIFSSGRVGKLTMAFTALLFVHVIFVETLFDAHARNTRLSKLFSNLVWSTGYIFILISLYAAIFDEFGVSQGGQAVVGNFGVALFFSVVTWTTVGYGDITVTEPVSQFFAACEALNGYLIMAVFIASLIQTFQRMARLGDGGV